MPRPKTTGQEMTGVELRARRLRLPSYRNQAESRTQPELAEDLGYNPNTLAQLERGTYPLGKRGRILHLALCTLERRAGLEEWPGRGRSRETFIRDAREDLDMAGRNFAGKGRAASEAGGKKQPRAKHVDLGGGRSVEIQPVWYGRERHHMWRVVLPQRIGDKRTFNTLSRAAEQLSGRYVYGARRRPGGFQFLNPENAEQFARSLTDLGYKWEPATGGGSKRPAKGKK